MNRNIIRALSVLLMSIILVGCGNETDTTLSSDNTKDVAAEAQGRNDSSMQTNLEEATFDLEGFLSEMELYQQSVIDMFPAYEEQIQGEMNPDILSKMECIDTWTNRYEYRDENFAYIFSQSNQEFYTSEYIGNGGVAVIPKYIEGYPVYIEKTTGENVIDTLVVYAPTRLNMSISNARKIAYYPEENALIWSEEAEVIYCANATNMTIAQNSQVLADVAMPKATDITFTGVTMFDNWKTVYLPEMERTFYPSGAEVLCCPKAEFDQTANCKNLKTIVASTSGEWKGVTSESIENIVLIGELKELGTNSLKGCQNLKYIDLSKVEIVGTGVFDGCGLENVSLPAAINIGENAICKMPNLKVVNIPKVTSLPIYAVSGNDSLYAVYADSCEEIGNRAFDDCGALKIIEAPKATAIGEHAFSECGTLEEVNLPAVTTIGKKAFENCSSLKKAKFGNLTEVADDAFVGCDKLKTADKIGK